MGNVDGKAKQNKNILTENVIWKDKPPPPQTNKKMERSKESQTMPETVWLTKHN